jgi:hypothetical protein
LLLSVVVGRMQLHRDDALVTEQHLHRLFD